MKAKKNQETPEDGEFLRFHVGLVEALSTSRELTLVQVKIILYVVRMTWGWNRKFFRMIQSVAVVKLGINKGDFSRNLSLLIGANVLIFEGRDVGINKYTDTWETARLRGHRRHKLVQNQQVGAEPTSWCKPNSKLVQNQQGLLVKPAPPADHSDPYRHDYIDKTNTPYKVPPDPASRAETETVPREGVVTTATTRAKGSRARWEDPLFVTWYSAYPRKVKRKKAAEAFAKIGVDEELLAKMLATLSKQVLLPKWQERDESGDFPFVPHPTTYLNDRRWEDVLPEPVRKPEEANPRAYIEGTPEYKERMSIYLRSIMRT